MSTIVQCPTCLETTPFHRPPIASCPRCQASFPESVRGAAERALRHDLAPKPALLVLGQVVMTFMAGIFLLFLPMASFNVGSYSIGDQQMDGHDFVRHGGALAFGLVGLAFGVIAYGLWRDRPWTRPLMLAYWPVVAAVLVAVAWNDPDFAENVAVACVSGVIETAVAGWYLYRKANVVAYFEAHDPDVRGLPESYPSR
jgi:uncharacterized membrane protein HdeD (DUF308 family)